MSPVPPRRPLIAVVGATGTGKSQLAVFLAGRFNGEIVNGDALQIYEGLPITTNKIPVHERKGIPHHLLGCVKLGEEPWTVHQYRDRAAKIIEDIRSRKKIPILVGGSQYYTQSLLFKDAVIEGENFERLDEEDQEQRWPMLGASTEVMLEELRRIDPTMAQQWHPNDRRKIRRSLEIWLTTGKKASKLYEQQQHVRTGIKSDTGRTDCDLDGNWPVTKAKPPLLHNTLIFWTHVHPDTLNPRLDKRVDSMVADGLLEEVQSMYSFARDQEQHGNIIDQGRGIWVAIGFKEYLPYLLDGNVSETLKIEGTERTKVATKQYAKRQVRWIRLRLQRAIDAASSSDKLFLLNATDLSQWPQDVEVKAKDIAQAFLGGAALPKPESLSPAAKEMLVKTEATSRSARYCDACNKTMMLESEWLAHLKSKGHKTAVRPKIDWQALYPKGTRKREILR